MGVGGGGGGGGVGTFLDVKKAPRNDQHAVHVRFNVRRLRHT